MKPLYDAAIDLSDNALILRRIHQHNITAAGKVMSVAFRKKPNLSVYAADLISANIALAGHEHSHGVYALKCGTCRSEQQSILHEPDPYDEPIRGSAHCTVRGRKPTGVAKRLADACIQILPAPKPWTMP